MDIILTILIGVVVGVVATWIFWKWLLSKEPDIEISDCISICGVPGKNNKKYSIKIRNKGSNQVIDITLKAWLCELESVQGHDVTHGIEELPFNNSITRTLAPKGKSKRPWGLTSEAELSTISDKDIKQVSEDNNYRILITLRATDAISGTTRVQQKIYTPNEMIEGIFGYQEDMTVSQS